jgi:hypothetical protein
MLVTPTTLICDLMSEPGLVQAKGEYFFRRNQQIVPPFNRTTQGGLLMGDEADPASRLVRYGAQLTTGQPVGRQRLFLQTG